MSSRRNFLKSSYSAAAGIPCLTAGRRLLSGDPDISNQQLKYQNRMPHLFPMKILRVNPFFIGNDAVQMVQQDLFYFGGMIRCMKVSRMAASKGYLCTPHISGTGLGYIYMMQFVSAIPNAGPYHKFKGLSDEVPFACESSSLKPEDGILHLPKGVGSSVEIDPDFIAKHQIMK